MGDWTRSPTADRPRNSAGRPHQDPPPPPPPPPPGEPPAPKPPDPEAAGGELIVPTVATVKGSIELANATAVNGCDPTYHEPVSGWRPSCSKAFAHFSVQPNTIAYGRYFE